MLHSQCMYYDEFDWVNDYVPPCATETGSAWDWTSMTGSTYVKFGTRCHTDATGTGYHYHRFTGVHTSQTMTVSPADSLFVWVYPRSGGDQTTEIMLEWYGSSTWYRAYWKAASGTGTGLTGAYYAGALPTTSTYTKLKVKASDIGISSTITLDGMGFGCVDGQVVYDRAGKIISDGTGAGLTTELYDDYNAAGTYITNLKGTRTFSYVPAGFQWWSTGGGTSGAPDDINGSNCSKLGMSSDGNTWGLRMVGYFKAPVTSSQYSFRVTSDDGARIWVNSTKVFENWNDHSCAYSGSTSTVSSLTVGAFYPIIVDYYNNSAGTCFYSLQYSSDNGSTWADIPSGSLFTYDYPAVANGLKASYYNSNNTSDCSGSGCFYANAVNSCNYWNSWTNSNFWCDGSTLTVNWGDANNNYGRPYASAITGMGGQYWWNYAIKWTGYIMVPTEGDYYFQLLEDDEGYLEINGTPIITSRWGNCYRDNCLNWFAGPSSIHLLANTYYPFTWYFAQLVGGAQANLQYKVGAGGTWAYVPISYLYTDKLATGVLTVSAGTAQTVCSGSTATLGGSPTALGGKTPYTYSWATSSGTTPSATANPTVSPTVSTTYTVTVTDACSLSSSSSVAITIVSPSTAPTTISGSSVICSAGGSTTLTASGGTDGTGATMNWYTGSCGPVFIQEWFNQPYTTDQTTVNSVSGGILDVTSTGGDPKILMYPNLGSWDPTIYKYIQIRYKVVTGTANQVEIYYCNPGNSNSPSQAYMTNATLISDNAWHIVNVDMTTAGTNTASNTDPVNNWQSHGNLIGWRFDYCTTNSGVRVQVDYIALASSQAVGQGSSITVSPTTATTYYVLRSGQCNTTSCAQTTVTISNLTASAGNASNSCGGSTITLGGSPTASGGSTPYTYSWASNPAGFSSTTANPTAAPNVNTTYTVSVSDPSGCTITSSVAKSVNVIPSANAQVSVATICSGVTVTLSANASSGTTPYTYSWYSNPSGYSSTLASPTAAPTTTTTYTVKVTDACSQTVTSSVLVNVNPLPSASPTAIPPAVCSGTASTLSVNPSGGTAPYTYAWSANPPGTAQSATVNVASTYTVTVTDNKGCSASGNVVVASGAGPSISTSATPSTICNGSSTTLSANPSGGTTPYTYLWSNSLGLTQTVNASPVAATIYTVTVTENSGCTSTATVAVGVNAKPTITLAGTTTICKGATTSVTATPTGPATPYNYNWSSEPLRFTWTQTSSAAVSFTDTPPLYAISKNANNSFQYKVTVTDNNGCTNALTRTITVRGLIKPADTICSGGSTILKAAGGSLAANYAWSANSGCAATQTCAVSPATTTTYTVTVNPLSGSCSENAVVYVAPCTGCHECDASGTALSGASNYTTSAPNEKLYIRYSDVFTGNITINHTGCTLCICGTWSPPAAFSVNQANTTINNWGTINVTNSFSIFNSTTVLVNNGSILASGTGDFRVQDGATFTNKKTFYSESTGTFYLQNAASKFYNTLFANFTIKSGQFKVDYGATGVGENRGNMFLKYNPGNTTISSQSFYINNSSTFTNYNNINAYGFGVENSTVNNNCYIGVDNYIETKNTSTINGNTSGGTGVLEMAAYNNSSVCNGSTIGITGVLDVCNRKPGIPGTNFSSSSGCNITTTHCTNLPAFYSANPHCLSLLPIELIYFKSICTDNKTKLCWATATETNNDHFTLEVSTNGTDFTELKQIKGAGNSKEIKYYYEEIHSEVHQTMYYRLKQTDYNGAFTYSHVVSTDKDCMKKQPDLFYTLAPNPSTSDNLRLTLLSSVEQKISVTCYDMIGQNVFEKIIPVDENQPISQLLPLHHLSPGFYMVVLANSYRKYVEKIIIK